MKYFYTLITLFIFTTSFGQSIKKLDDKNGFKDIILGAAMTNYPDFKIFEKKKEGTDEIEVYIYNGTNEDYSRIGDARMKTIANVGTGYESRSWIEVSAKDGFIVEIKATLEGKAGTYNAGAYLNSVLEKAYGKATKVYAKQGSDTETYIWETEKLIMNLKVFGDDRVVLTFIKKKQIEDDIEKGTNDL